MALPIKMIMGGIIAAVSVLMVFFIIDYMTTGVMEVTEEVTGAFVSGITFSDIPALDMTEQLDLLPRPSKELSMDVI